MMAPVFGRGIWWVSWRELRSRRDRAVALGGGILVAAVSFSLLTAAVSSSRLAVRGTVGRSFRPAYDILVRPRGAASRVERSAGLVRDNYLAGMLGGISVAQWRRILAVRGVQVAAPIANVGYVVLDATVVVPLGGVTSSSSHQLYRVGVSWRAADGLSTYPGGTSYVYFTPTDRFVAGKIPGQLLEVTPGRARPVPVCAGFPSPAPSSPLDSGADGFFSCYSARTPAVSTSSVFGLGSSPGAVVGFSFPLLLSAIDPGQEAKLLGLDHTMVSGRYLSGTTGLQPPGSSHLRGLPVLAASRTYLDQSLSATVTRLHVPSATSVSALMSGMAGTSGYAKRFHGQIVGHRVVTPQAAYAALLGQVTHPPRFQAPGAVDAFWTTTPTAYKAVAPQRLRAVPTTNPPSVWNEVQLSGGGAPPLAPPGNQDTQFRRLAVHAGQNTSTAGGPPGIVGLLVRGEFDPARLPGFNPLSKVPLQTYYPPTLTGADSRSRRLLHGRPLGPSMNLGGYVAQPPLLLTTITAARQLLSGSHYAHTDAAAPISAVRVRVAGVHGFGSTDQARILAVATAIRDRTGLQVDITAGSSPTTVEVSLPAGCCGRPALAVAEGWVRKGAAVVVVRAIDNKSLLLFVLVLAVCAVFLANGAYASVRARRSELGVLSCLGWARNAIFVVILAELATVGLLAGVAGAIIATLIAVSLQLQLPLWRAALVVPVAVGLASVAGLLPAWAATRRRPLDAVLPVVGRGRRGHHRRRIPGITGLAIANVTRRPARLATGALGLFLGVAAFTIVLGIEVGFQGHVVGTALGRAVSVQVRTVDVVAATLTLLLGAVSVADVMAMNWRERSAEQAVLAATGWHRGTLTRLGITEGLLAGLAGALPGAAVGLGLATWLTGNATTLAPAAGIAAAAGIALVAVAISLPATRSAATPPARALADE